MKYKIFTILLILSVGANAQVEIGTNISDTSKTSDRYVNYADDLLIKVMTVVKSNKLEIENTNNDQSIKLAPLGMTSIGLGFNYKWLGLAASYGLPSSAEDKEKYGETERFDFQLNVYSQKFVVDAFLQDYKGFHVENPSDLTTWNEEYYPKRDSMETASIGASGYYVFNHKKLSYKAAYVRNAVQKKSAGSFLLGGFFNLDYAGFKSGASSFFVPGDFPQEVKDSLPIGAYLSKSFGISIGYTYTFVFLKNFFINASLIPGIGVENLRINKNNGEEFEESAATSRFIGRVALGYENKHFLMGFTSYSTTGTIDFEHFQLKPSTTNVRFFIAKRFNLSKKEKESNNLD